MNRSTLWKVVEFVIWSALFTILIMVASSGATI